MQQGYEKENIAMSNNEIREKIIEQINNIHESWLLGQIYRLIINIQK